jgi:hypothetical protein
MLSGKKKDYAAESAAEALAAQAAAMGMTPDEGSFTSYARTTSAASSGVVRMCLAYDRVDGGPNELQERRDRKQPSGCA